VVTQAGPDEDIAIVTPDKHDVKMSSRPLARILTREEAHIQREKAFAFMEETLKDHKCGICHWGGERTREEVTIHIQIK
jgi:hypothetical protein